MNKAIQGTDICYSIAFSNHSLFLNLLYSSTTSFTFFISSNNTSNMTCLVGSSTEETLSLMKLIIVFNAFLFDALAEISSKGL